MPLGSIIRLSTYLVDRNDKANEDVAAVLDHLAQLSEDIAEKWSQNLANMEKLKFEGSRIRDGRRNEDFLEQLDERGLSVGELASFRRANDAYAYDASELIRAIPEDVAKRFNRVAERFTEPTERRGGRKNSKAAKKRNSNAFEDTKRAVASLLRSRSELRKKLDELFDDVDKTHGSEFSGMIDDLDIPELERKVANMLKQAAKAKALARYYRSQIR